MDQSFLAGYKEIREMIKYLNIMLIKFPKHEKFLLAGKIKGNTHKFIIKHGKKK